MEEWRAVVDYEGLYEVSRNGLIRRIAPWRDGRKTKPAPWLKGKITPSGYHRVRLHRDGGHREFAAHRLVAAAFIGKCPDLYQVNHLDGNKANNLAANLEYVTASENQFHSYRILKRSSNSGSKHPMAKLTEEDIPRILAMKDSGIMQKDIAAAFKVSQTTVSEVIHGKMWKCSLLRQTAKE